MMLTTYVIWNPNIVITDENKNLKIFFFYLIFLFMIFTKMA